MFQVLAYKKSVSGNENVAPNFKVKEFACHDLSDVVLIDPLLVWVLQNVRDHFNAPVTINSGYRTPAHNESVGGASGSYHVLGMAADIVVKNVPAETVAEYLETVMPNTGGIGIDAGYVHVDTRATKSRWNY